jgi:hypothetical protein
VNMTWGDGRQPGVDNPSPNIVEQFSATCASGGVSRR